MVLLSIVMWVLSGLVVPKMAIQWFDIPQTQVKTKTSDGSAEVYVKLEVPPGEIYQILAAEAVNKNRAFGAVSLYIKDREDPSTSAVVLAEGQLKPAKGEGAIWWHGEMFAQKEIVAAFYNSTNGDELKLHVQYRRGIIK